MEGLYVFIIIFGVVPYSHGLIHESVMTVRPGENITFFCDCHVSLGVHIVWYRNCSHVDQPTLVLKTRDFASHENISSHFHFKRNISSNSDDLLIMNITSSDEGLYFCGTEQRKVDKIENIITSKYEYRYGNITTRIIFNSSEPCHHEPAVTQGCGSCWMLLFSLCPTSAVLSCLLSTLVTYRLCHKKAEAPRADHPKPEARGPTGINQGEDVCYAPLEIRQTSQRSKKKRSQSSDFSTYSAIKTSRL